MNEQQMGFMEHVAELRRRLFVCAVFFIVAFVAGLFLSKPIIVMLEHAPMTERLSLNAFRLTDPMFVYMECAFILALVLTGPLLLYQLWAFVSPGLYDHERRITLMYIPLTLLLFLAGLGFSYFVLLPFVMDFLIGLTNDLQIEGTFGIYEYFTFLVQLTLPFGFVFELPLLAMFLTRLGLITPMFLRAIRKYAYFVLLIVAGLITPPDVVSQLVVMVPLVILYEISIWISGAAYRKVKQAEALLQQED
ncbi:MAG TPA: twin-arginine translocase subunit TatC [Bacillales bacterium]|nr:twin-arginine translocase subunit TatC [Bacillales bacterium]